MDDGKRWTIRAFDTKVANKKETPAMTEGELTRDAEGLPRCPECRGGLGYVSPGDRDTETMGGESVDYMKCDRCNTEFEIVGDRIYPTSNL